MPATTPTGDAARAEVNTDLQRERAAATFASEDFAEWWAGGRTALAERRALEQHFFDDAEFVDPVHISYLSHKELYAYTVAKSTKFLKKLRQWQHEQSLSKANNNKNNNSSSSSSGSGSDATTIQELYELRSLICGSLGGALLPQSHPLRLHFSMFLPTLLSQGTEEQRREWLPRAWQIDGIVGTYAQTELGHGTYIRGLQTRADYDVATEQFVLNSPELSAYKWWPGGLGQTANMVVVMAQLYIKGKHYGLQPFLVRIRNAATHEPEPGIDVGDIGARMGGNGINNGFLGFRNVRVPRKQMLMQNSQVQPDGTFVKGPEPLLLYGTMVFVRVMIVRDVMQLLLQAATIATRYSAVRRQSPIDPRRPEPQIIDHVTQQAKVLPQIAKGMCFRLAADYVWQYYQQVMQELGAGDRRNLPELHALSCCLKAVITQEASEGVETLRKACGGQGYMVSANFSTLYSLATAAYTYEGEYTVLLLQAARFLVKQYVNSHMRRRVPKSVTYFRDTTRLKWTQDLLANAVQALEKTAVELVRRAWIYQRAQAKKCGSEHQAANRAGIKLAAAAAMHGRAFVARNAYVELQRLQPTVKPALYAVLHQLTSLFVYDLFLRNLGDILLCNSIRATQIAQLEQHYEQLLAALRTNAVAIVDGFDYHDRVLNSTLGCYDGRVYERLMAEARKNPLNQQPVDVSFQTHLQSFMRGKL